MNLFKLTPLEKRHLRRDVKHLTEQMQLPISYYNFEYKPSNQHVSDWSEFDDYRCGVQEVDETNVRRFDYGDIKQGDIVIYLPYDTSLPSVSKYRVKYNNIEYLSKSKYNPKKAIDGTILYYVLVGRR